MGYWTEAEGGLSWATCVCLGLIGVCVVHHVLRYPLGFIMSVYIVWLVVTGLIALVGSEPSYGEESKKVHDECSLPTMKTKPEPEVKFCHHCGGSLEDEEPEKKDLRCSWTWNKDPNGLVMARLYAKISIRLSLHERGIEWVLLHNNKKCSDGKVGLTKNGSKAVCFKCGIKWYDWMIE